LQAGSLIVPACALSVAADRMNDTEPKFASGSGLQRPADVHVDGASAIHSAEVRSGAATVTRLVARVCRVLVVSWSVTWVPWTRTAAVIRSPGWILSRSGVDGAGTISYQAS